MKLIANRPALITGALDGYGTAANDLLGVDTEYYASDLPQRHQDIAQAKFLLKKAGKENLSFDLPTCNALPAFIPSSTLFAQQAALAGVKVNVQIVSANTYYTPSGDFLKRPPGGQAAWNLINEAISAADPAKAQQLWHEVQVQQYNEGGILGWTNSDDLAAVGKNVHGISVGREGYMNYYRLLGGWLT
jgi:peptide/nickel transport system substrate-binding protein